MPYTYTLTTTIPASAQEIYDAWLDSIGHSEMTGGAAEMSDEIGAEISAWDGYISGRNLELVPGERIVQSWRTTKFSEEHEDSIITVTLEELDDGTLLTLVHSNVPDDHRSYEEGGWHSRYFEPMQAYFAAGEPSEEPEPERAKPTPEPVRPSPKSRAPRTRRAAGRKTRAAVPAKASPAKKKPKRAAVAKTKRKTAKTAKKKPEKKSIKRPATKRAATKRTAAKRIATKRTAAKRTAAKGKAGRRKRR